MEKSVNLYLASVVIDGNGFWLIDFTEEDEIVTSLGNKFLECYRKELFGIDAATDVKDAISQTLDILSSESRIEKYKFDKANWGYSYDIPLYIIEDIFDLWVDNYHNNILWEKYIGILNFRRKIKITNNYINLGLKGNSYEFAVKLDQLLSYRPINHSFRTDKSNKLMW